MPALRQTRLSLCLAWLLILLDASGQAFQIGRRSDETEMKVDEQVRWTRKGLRRCRPRSISSLESSITSISRDERTSPRSTRTSRGSSKVAGSTTTHAPSTTSGIVSPTAKETGWCPKIWDPESGPSFRDISQNYKADDCGLLSAAASMALINPDAVKQAIPQPECGASPENGTYAKVTLYDWDLQRHDYNITIANVSGQFTIDGLTRDETGWSWTEGGWVWIGIWESAYEKLTGDRTAYIDRALTAFTGVKATSVPIGGDGWNDSLLELSTKHAMVTQTSTTEDTTNGLLHGHAYSIFSANATHAILRNPWGATPTSEDAVPPSSQDLSNDPDWGPAVFVLPINASDGTGTLVDQQGGLTQISWLPS